MQRLTIFDIGMHRGVDAKFYLRKGFRVIGVEASTNLCNDVMAADWAYLVDGSLSVVNKALYSKSGETVSFFTNPKKDEWGSLFRGASEQGETGVAIESKIGTVTLGDLFDEFGHPYYIKCDIEGGDEIFVEQLRLSKVRPPFVSIEATEEDVLKNLRDCGYDKFQLVNQYNNVLTASVHPPREGRDIKMLGFSRQSSGLFGRELPEHRWAPFEDTLKRFKTWYELRGFDENLAIGWLDVHATKTT